MNTILEILLLTVLLSPLLLFDSWVKRRRRKSLPSISDSDFLAEFDTAEDEQEILKARELISKEIYFPKDKLHPKHDIRAIQTRYSPVTLGDLGISDLYDDLYLDAKSKGVELTEYPETVKGYIEMYLRYSDRSD
ncbi:MAG: hypothetical protein AAGD01_07880 [Acidobacteriota bacterium]